VIRSRGSFPGRRPQDFQILDNRPHVVSVEFVLECGHIVDLDPQLDGVTVPDLVEQNPLGVDRVAERVGEIRCVIRLTTSAPGFSGLFSSLPSAGMSQP
jgi:hypothetical protein